MRAAGIALLALVLLAGCRSESVSGLDEQIVCSLRGEAFFIRPGVGDTSFVIRTITADNLCKALKP